MPIPVQKLVAETLKGRLIIECEFCTRNYTLPLNNTSIAYLCLPCAATPKKDRHKYTRTKHTGLYRK